MKRLMPMRLGNWGDVAAFRLGRRVTFNLLMHVDPFGTILLPTLLFLTKAPFLFGWAKPVPVAFRRLGKPRRDMMLVAMAGPLTNIVLALVSAALPRMVWLLPEEIAPVRADALPVDSVEPDPGSVQHGPHPVLGWQSRPHEHSAQGSRAAIRKAGALRIPHSPRDHLPSADAWQTDRNRSAPVPLDGHASAYRADADFSGYSWCSRVAVEREEAAS
jgi:hypothetical protein